MINIGEIITDVAELFVEFRACASENLLGVPFHVISLKGMTLLRKDGLLEDLFQSLHALEFLDQILAFFQQSVPENPRLSRSLFSVVLALFKSLISHITAI